MARSPEWSPKTTVENQRQIRLKIEPRLGKRRLSKIRPADLDALYAELRQHGGEKGQPLEPASVRRVHIILRRLRASDQVGADRGEPRRRRHSPVAAAGPHHSPAARGAGRGDEARR
jgi:hypothetical protein